MNKHSFLVFSVLATSLFFINCSENAISPPAVEDKTTILPHTITIENDDWKDKYQCQVSFTAKKSDISPNKKRGISAEERVDLVNYRLSKVTSILFEISDSTKSYIFSFDFTGDTCSNYFSLPKNRKYRIVTYLRCSQSIPWDNIYVLYDRPFYCVNNVDLTAKASEEIDLNFIENVGMTFLIQLKNPPGELLEGRKYKCENGNGANTSFFEDSTLYAWLYSGNLDYNIGHLTYWDETEKKYQISFICNYKMLIDSGFFRVEAPNIILGNIYFEFKITLRADSAAYRNNLIYIYFNKFGYPWHRDSVDFIFKVTDLASNEIVGLDSSTNFSSKKGNLLLNTTFLTWDPVPRLNPGLYSVEIKGITDQYGQKLAVPFKDTVEIGG